MNNTDFAHYATLVLRYGFLWLIGSCALALGLTVLRETWDSFSQWRHWRAKRQADQRLAQLHAEMAERRRLNLATRFGDSRAIHQHDAPRGGSHAA